MAMMTRSCPSPTRHCSSVKLLKKGTLKVYEKFPHGMCTTHADIVNPGPARFHQKPSGASRNGERIMKIVVIGGSGLIGSKTVERLRNKGHEVISRVAQFRASTP